MKFFGLDKPEFPDIVCIHLLSFFSFEEIAKLALVNKDWLWTAEMTRTLMLAIQRIPELKSFKLSDFRTFRLSQGMTNLPFKLVKGDEKWALRIPGKGSSAMVNRKIEYDNAKQATDKELNVAIHFFDQKDGLQLTKFLNKGYTLDKAIETHPALSESILDATAKAMSCLHSSLNFHNDVNFFARNEQYLLTLKNKSIPLPDDIMATEAIMTKIKKLISCYKISPAACHYDTTPENFLVTFPKESPKPKVHLLDWEYSARGTDKVIDFAYTLWGLRLSSEQRQFFIKSYFGDYNEEIEAWLHLYEPVVGLWYAIWSWTQISNQANSCRIESYQALAEVSYKRVKDITESDSFKQALSFIEEETQTDSFTQIRGFL